MDLLPLLQQAAPGASIEPVPSIDEPTAYVPREHLLDACRALRDTPELRFSVLVDVIGVDLSPKEPRFEVVYHLLSIGSSGEAARRFRLKTRVPGADPHVTTVSSVWPAADWGEREVFDLLGVIFDGHPALKRILMPDDWEGHPLRKDYPVQVRVTPRAQEPLQISPEQFAANIRARRAADGKEPE